MRRKLHRKKSDRELRFNLRKNPALAKLLKSDRELRSSAPEKDPAQEPPKEVKIDDEDDDTTEAKKSMFKTPLKETKPCGGMPDVLLPCGKEKESLQYVYPRRMGTKYFCSVICLDAFRNLVNNLDSDQMQIRKINELENSLKLDKLRSNAKIAEKEKNIEEMTKSLGEMKINAQRCIGPLCATLMSMPKHVK